MSKQILAAKPVVRAIADDIAVRNERLAVQGITPTLAVLRVGARPDDLSYEGTLVKRAAKLGVQVRVLEQPENVNQETMLAQIEAINADDTLHACLMFRPLPRRLDEKALCSALAVEKDIDGISEASMAALFADESCFAPSTAEACVRILDHYGIAIAGKRVVVIGRSLVIGKPVAMMLLRRNATVTICHSRTEDLPSVVREADIVIAATGRAKAYGPACFREGQTVIDVGINFADGVLCGDVDYDAVEPIVDAITPVPGGVGSVTTSTTLEHVVTAAERADEQAAERAAERADEHVAERAPERN